MAAGLNPLIFGLTTAISSRSMYPAAHPQAMEATQRLYESLQATLAERKTDSITFLVVGEDLVEGDRPIRHTTLYVETFQRALARRGVERLSLGVAAATEELELFLAGMCGLGPLATTDNVILGKVNLDFGSDEDGEGQGAQGEGTGGAEDGSGEVRGFSERDLDAAQESFSTFRTDRKGSVKALDGVMWHLMEGLGRSSRSLLLLAPLKGADDRAFIHSINVSLMVLAQGRSLGISGQPLHDLGMAALLHDIGKLSLPPEIVHKQGKLDEREEAIVRQHPELGAVHLSGVSGSTTLSVLVAYEHHLRWDGRPSYPVLRNPRRPNLGSQLTAIADTYDVALSLSPLPRESAQDRALAVVEERAGTFLNPALCSNFAWLMRLETNDGIAEG
ncbi:MAG: HD domain-containing protein [Thermoanaerobaculia bacterium]|nr:HD domain-containing protein [Thermoanaerobaculia bacterium]